MALGAGSVTPMQMATAYSVFANGGYRVNPWLITRVTDQKGKHPVETVRAARHQQQSACHRRTQRLRHGQPAAGR